MHLRAPNRRKALFTLAGLVAGAGAPGCTHKSEPEPDRLVVATGPPGAVYREIGGEIALLLDERLDRTEVETVETGASRDNLSLLQEGRAHLGLANLDSILATEFSKEHDISAIGRLYDSFVHLVVLRKAPIGALSDLDGLRVSVGEVNSGTEFTVTQIIEKTGLQMEEVRLDQATSAEALAQGNIDAMFSLTGLPTPAIADLAEAREIRLIDLADTAEVMTDVSPDAYFPASIPATTYHGVPARPTFSAQPAAVRRWAVRRLRPHRHRHRSSGCTPFGFTAARSSADQRPYRNLHRDHAPAPRGRRVVPRTQTRVRDPIQGPVGGNSTTTPNPGRPSSAKPSSRTSRPPASRNRSATIAKPRPVPSVFWCCVERQKRFVANSR